MLFIQGMKHHRSINAIKELGAESLLHLAEHFFLHLVILYLLFAFSLNMGRKADAHVALDELRTSVASHDYDAITKIDPSSLGIGQMTIIENLEKNIENIIMRLFNLIKKNGTIGLPPYCFSQLTAFLVADITWWCSH